MKGTIVHDICDYNSFSPAATQIFQFLTFLSYSKTRGSDNVSITMQVYYVISSEYHLQQLR